MDRPAPTPVPAHFASLEVDEQSLDNGAQLVSVRGEVDLSSAPALKLALSALAGPAGPRDLVLELSALNHLDSTGLAVLIGFRKRLTADQRLVIASPSDEVRRLLALTGLDSSFDLFATVDDALHYLAETGGCSPELPLSPDAALILGLASTALPFADSLAAEARCWQRILLPEAGAVPTPQERLFSDAPEEHPAGAPRAEATEEGAGCHQRLERVLAHAARLALDRGASVIRTGDLLRGVVHIYGNLFEPGLDVAI
jgi:anti-sigma B factor antagonist